MDDEERTRMTRGVGQEPGKKCEDISLSITYLDVGKCGMGMDESVRFGADRREKCGMEGQCRGVMKKRDERR